jgi:dethiobiotin synthetase
LFELASQMRGLIVTGTDTGVGKTYVAVEIIRALREQGVRVGAYKPVVSGRVSGGAGEYWDDPARLQAALGCDVPIERIAPQRFLAPLAPPVAARLEGLVVDPGLLRRGIDWWIDRVDIVIVEGAGGLLSPLTETETLADLARDLGFPMVIVARLSLGTINHSLLTLEAADRRQLPVAGIVLNEAGPADPTDRSVETNPEELQRRCETPILAILRHAATPGLLRVSPLSTIDWMRLAQSGEHQKRWRPEL